MLETRDWEIVVAENTLGSEDSFRATHLGQAAKGLKHVLLTRNLGRTNKGVGEFDMMSRCLVEFDTSNFDSIAYMSGRMIVANRFVFERVEDNPGRTVLGNPDFLFVKGKFVESEKSHMFSTGFFAMSPADLGSLVEYFNTLLSGGIPKGFGSEQMLYQFVQHRKIDPIWLEFYGFLRFELSPFGRKRWHVW